MATNTQEWIKNVIKQDEIDKYLIDGKDFIDEALINKQLAENTNPTKEQIRNIIKKSLSIKTLSPVETAALINVKDPEIWEEIYTAAQEVKRKVYDNRIVFFAPLYCSNLCVNNCAYCGFKSENKAEKRRTLTMDEITKEAEAVISEGHKRMIVVYGEHPSSNIDYMVDSIKTIYKAKVPNKKGYGDIRRVNVNAAPLCIDDLVKLKDAGIGTYQVFQETYHRATYEKVHPQNTLKGNFHWRLYALHRAMDAGIDDMAIGALFGLYDWKFEVMGLLYHALDMEKQLGIGPHTVSFPRLTQASGSELSTESKYLVSDEDLKKLVAIIRLSIPYSGLIITAREEHELRLEVIKDCGCTQTDASTKIGIGAYSHTDSAEKELDTEQFTITDPASLDNLIKELAKRGLISSFCTAGYRCGRTGDKIMGLLRTGTEGKFCKLNAVLTFKEFLDDYASDETKEIGEQLLLKELEEIKKMPFYKDKKILSVFDKYFEDIKKGKRDIYI